MPNFTIGNDPAPKSGGTPASAGAKKPAGRPPAGAAKHKQNVELALSTMESVYNLTGMGMLMLRRPETAETIVNLADQWQAGNRQAFESSEKLAEAIANLGQASGTVTFISVNLYAAFSIYLAMREEGAKIRAAEWSAESQPEG